MKNIVFLLLLSITLFSCGEDPIVGPHFGTGPYFIVVDEDGNDLLDPNTPNFINIKNISSYYLVNGELKEPLDVLKLPLGYSNIDTLGIIQDDNRKYHLMSILFNPIPNRDNIATTYIKWSENDTDTIKSRISEKGVGYGNYMVSFNGILWKEDSSNKIGSIHVYTIVKNR